MKEPRVVRMHPSVIDSMLITKDMVVALSLSGATHLLVGTVHEPLCGGVVTIWPFGCKRPRAVERDAIVAADTASLTFEQVRGYARLQREEERKAS